MKIIFVSKGLGNPKHGAEGISKLIQQFLDKEVILYSLTDDRKFTGKGEIFFNPTLKLKIPFVEYLSYHFFGKRKLKKMCKEIKPDLVVISSFSGYAIPSPRNIRTVVIFQDDPIFNIKDDLSPKLISFLLKIWYSTMKYFKKSLIKKEYNYFSISSNISKSIMKLGISSNKIYTLPYGFYDISKDNKITKEIWEKMCKDYELAENDYLILFVGTLYYIKGLHTIIDSLNILNNSRIKLLVTGGETPFFGKYYTNRIKKRVDQYKLNNQIIWLGLVDKETIKVLYQNCSVIISASYSEGSQLSLTEAACYELPIIASKVGSAEEQFKGKALFFEPGNEKELTNRILELLISKTAKIEYNLYSFETFIGKMIEWFKELIKNK